MQQQHLIRGALYVVGAELMFASVGAIVRHLSTDLSHPMLVFFRNLAGLLFLLPLIAGRGGLSLRTAVPHLHLLRGLAGLAAMYCYFYAIIHMPLANAMLLKLSAPLFIPLVALFWLNEALTLGVMIAVLLGFAGVAVILVPDLQTMAPVAAVALLGGLFAAIAKVSLRRLSATEPATRTVFYFALLGSLLSAVPLAWSWIPPRPEHWAWLAAIGLIASLGQLCMTRGFGLAHAGSMGVFGYFSVVFGAAWGWYLWDEPLSSSTIAGSLLVMSAGMLVGARGASRRRFVSQNTENAL